MPDRAFFIISVVALASNPGKGFEPSQKGGCADAGLRESANFARSAPANPFVSARNIEHPTVILWDVSFTPESGQEIDIDAYVELEETIDVRVLCVKKQVYATMYIFQEI